MVSILHIWDVAGVACTLAKYQRKSGHIADVIKRHGFDKFKIMEFYQQKSIKSWYGGKFLKIAAKEAENYEVIHVHDLIKLVPLLKKKFPQKKIILHYHGSLLRKTIPEIRREAEAKADKVLVSTPDLTQFVDGTYLPNPVDTDHFFPRNIPQNNEGISLMSKEESEGIIIDFLNKNKINVKFNPLKRYNDPIFYKNMPNFLSEYEYFVDLKIVHEGKPMAYFGLTGLQALSLGLKVINFEGKIKTELPDEHKPENVIKKLTKFY